MKRDRRFQGDVKAGWSLVQFEALCVKISVPRHNYDNIVEGIEAVLEGRSDRFALHDNESVATVSAISEIDVRHPHAGMYILVDRHGIVVQQNVSAASILGLNIGDQIAPIAETPQIARKFFADRAGTRNPLPFSAMTQAGDAVLFLGTISDGQGNIALHEVRRGLNDDIQERLAQTISLTSSERQVYFKLLEGQAIRDIAVSLGKTEGTIRQLVKAVMGKAGVRSQVQLVSIAYALSLTADRTMKPALAINYSTTSPALQTGRGGNTPYVRFGQPEGMPVLLIHGALFGIAALPALHVAAQSLGLDIIAPVRPGYGDASLPDDADAVDLTVRHACTILDACEINQAVVVAHDIGTRFAVRLACDHPDRVGAVVAAPTTPPMRNWGQTSDMPLRHRANAWASQNFPGLMDRLVTLALSQIARKGSAMIPQLVFAGCEFDQGVMEKDEFRPVLAEIFDLVMQQNGTGFCSDMRITNDDWSDELQALQVPLIALHGDRSLTVSRKAVEQMAMTVPDGHFRLVGNAGHSLPLSHPALVLRYAFAAGMRAGLAGSDHGVI